MVAHSHEHSGLLLLLLLLHGLLLHSLLHSLHSLLVEVELLWLHAPTHHHVVTHHWLLHAADACAE